jgi:predicted nucleic acid-binding Zn ribbon protein
MNPDEGYFVECSQCSASSKMVYPDKTDPKPILRDAWNSRSAKSMENEARCPDCNGTLRKCGIDTYKCRKCGEGWTVTAA